MPLIIFTGFPSSGKTTIAKEVCNLLQERIEKAKEGTLPGYNYSVSYHSDETLGINHNVYTDSNLEKHSRGIQMSIVKREISRSNIVVLDSLAYIKGFRYQLFCEAKGVLTPHCVIHVINPVGKCIEWNSSRENPESKWDENLIQQLVMRYEEPNGETRWDSPLFTISPELDHKNVPVDQIWEALVLKRPPPPNAATILKPSSSANFVQELDRKTSEVVKKVIKHQQVVQIGGTVVIDSAENLKVELPPSSVSIAQLQRIRRTYIGLNRMRVLDTDRIVRLFVEYLNSTLNSDE